MSVEGRWVDETSYYRGESKVPRVWGFNTGEVRLIVHRHIDGPGHWYLSCRDLDVDKLRLDSENVGDAKKEGLQAVYTCLTNKVSSLIPFLDSI